MRALIDGDIIVYRSGFAAEKTLYDIYILGAEEVGAVATVASKKDIPQILADLELQLDDVEVIDKVEVEPVENALYNAKSTIQTILEMLDTTDYQLYLTGKDNYRFDIATIQKYKDRPARKPHWYQEIRDYLVNVHRAIVIEGQEADDALSIEQWKHWEHEDFIIHNAKTCICSIDKDLNMVPGWHLNWTKEEDERLYYMTPDEGLRCFYRQMFTGDVVDTVPGIFKLTGQKATKTLLEPLDLMDTSDEMYDWVRSKYAEAGVDEDKVDQVLLEIGRLLWMRTSPDEMWSPF